MPKRLRKQRAGFKSIEEQIVEQLTWIEEHGETEAGYIERYGPKPCVYCADGKSPMALCAACENTKVYQYGNGGAAIYKADRDHLADLVNKALT